MKPFILSLPEPKIIEELKELNNIYTNLREYDYILGLVDNRKGNNYDIGLWRYTYINYAGLPLNYYDSTDNRFSVIESNITINLAAAYRISRDTCISHNISNILGSTATVISKLLHDKEFMYKIAYSVYPIIDDTINKYVVYIQNYTLSTIADIGVLPQYQ